MSPTNPSLQARWRVWRWILWLGLGALGVNWVWQTVLRERAADELRAAGFVVHENKIWEVARRDWHALFKLQSWRAERTARYDDVGRATPLRNLDAFVPALRRLHLVSLSIDTSALENVDTLRELPTLKSLGLWDCSGLQNVDGLKGLTQLESLGLQNWPALQNVDGLKGLTQLEAVSINYCPELQNVDGLKALTRLKSVMFFRCPQLSAQSIADLKAALPKAKIYSR